MQPTVFLPIIIWGVVVVPMPAPAATFWQQEQPVDPVDGWSEMVYQVPPRGSQLLLSFDQPMQFDFAEIVYQDGTAATVDLSGPVRDPGTYDLAAVDPTRVLDHVRIVGQATDSVADLQVIGE